MNPTPMTCTELTCNVQAQPSQEALQLSGSPQKTALLTCENDELNRSPVPVLMLEQLLEQLQEPELLQELGLELELQLEPELLLELKMLLEKQYELHLKLSLQQELQKKLLMEMERRVPDFSAVPSKGRIRKT